MQWDHILNPTYSSPLLWFAFQLLTFKHSWQIDNACEKQKRNGGNAFLRLPLSFNVCLFSGLSLATFLAICTFAELLSMWNLTRIEVQLCNMLSPEAPPLSLASYNWFLVSISPTLPYIWMHLSDVFLDVLYV